MENNNEQIIKDAQYRKGLSIAFFNATNAAISLVGNMKVEVGGDVLNKVKEIRDFFLEEHKNYYATVIANVGVNYKVEDSLAKLNSATDLESLQTAWRFLSEDERRNDEVKKLAQELKKKYEKA